MTNNRYTTKPNDMDDDSWMILQRLYALWDAGYEPTVLPPPDDDIMKLYYTPVPGEDLVARVRAACATMRVPPPVEGKERFVAHTDGGGHFILMPTDGLLYPTD